MASVVFFRAVNVGGHQKFEPSKLAKALADFGVISIGAAGTFVVREKVGAARLQREILEHLPFQPQMMICSDREILNLVESDPFRKAPKQTGIGQFASILMEAPVKIPALPFEQPAGSKWEVHVIAVTGRFALTVRRLGQTYSNAVIEKLLGVPATTRNWNTMQTICEVLRKPQPSPKSKR